MSSALDLFASLLAKNRENQVEGRVVGNLRFPTGSTLSEGRVCRERAGFSRFPTASILSSLAATVIDSPERIGGWISDARLRDEKRTKRKCGSGWGNTWGTKSNSNDWRLRQNTAPNTDEILEKTSPKIGEVIRLPGVDPYTPAEKPVAYKFNLRYENRCWFIRCKCLPVGHVGHVGNLRFPTTLPVGNLRFPTTLPSDEPYTNDVVYMIDITGLIPIVCINADEKAYKIMTNDTSDLIDVNNPANIHLMEEIPPDNIDKLSTSPDNIYNPPITEKSPTDVHNSQADTYKTPVRKRLNFDYSVRFVVKNSFE